MTRRHRRGRILLALALCAALAGSAAGFVLHSRAQPAAATGSTTAPVSARDRAQLHHMQALLNSGSVQAQGALLVPPARFAPGSGPVVPPGKTITILPGTLRSSGQHGTVQARLSDGTTVTLGLYSVQGHWRLYGATAGARTSATVTGQPARAQLAAAVSSAGSDALAAGTYQGVILVHGFGESASNWDSSGMSGKLRAIPETRVLKFDYAQVNKKWVSDPAIGPALADYIHQVAKASGRPVIVVGFSMGGLAIRWAANEGARAGDIAMVITIGTPNTGSLLGDGYNILCATAGLGVEIFGSDFCTQWQAASAMSVLNPEILTLPKLPASIPFLHAIAGEQTIVYKIGFAQVEIPLHGDGVVFTGSALDKRPGSMNDTYKPVASQLVPGDKSAWHLNLTSNLKVQQLVYNYINTYLQANPLRNPAVDLHSVDWARMAIPGSWFTGPPTVQLHPEPQFPSVGMATNVPSHIQGHVPNEPQDVQLGEDGPINVIYGDLGGAQVAAAPVWLNASGGGTADAQRGMAYLIYRAGSSGPVFIGVATSEAALPGAWAPNPKRADHTDLVTGASFQNGTLVIQEDFYGPSDIIAGPTGRGYTVWSLQGGELSYQNHITQPAAS